MNKLDILNNYVTLVHTSIDIFLISKTWLNAAVPDAQMGIISFTVIVNLAAEVVS